MKKEQMEQKVKSWRYNFVVAAILCLVLGIVLLVWPGTGSSVICRTIGAVLVIYGAVQIFAFLLAKEKTAVLALQMVVGVIAAALGVFFLVRPQMMLSVLPTLMGLFIIVVSCLSVKRAFDLRGCCDDQWWINLLLSIATIALGALIFFHPFGLVKIVMRLTGGVFLYVGVCDLWGIWKVVHTGKAGNWPE